MRLGAIPSDAETAVVPYIVKATPQNITGAIGDVTGLAMALVANTHHIIEGIIVNGANAGTLQLRAAAAGTSPSITIAAGSTIILNKLP